MYGIETDSKIVFVGSNVLFAVTWVSGITNLITHWRPSTGELHFEIGSMILFFSLLWVCLFRGCKISLAFLSAAFAFATAVDIASKTFR